MTWSEPLAKAPLECREEWTSNEAIAEAWSIYVGKRGAKNTQRNLRTYVGVFIDAFEGSLVTELQRKDIENFVDHISKKCKRLMRSTPPVCTWQHPIETCPLLTGGRFEQCADYQALLPSGVWSYIVAVNRFYNWLLAEGRISYNPAYPVMQDFRSRHKDWFKDRQRKPRKRHLSSDEVRLLVTQSPIQQGTAVLLMAKCFLREHEAHKLRWHPDYCNLEEGWIDIPPDWELGDKRLGCTRIIIDNELKHWLRKYRLWWEDKVKRDEDGEPITDRIVLTVFGKPWGKGGLNNFNRALGQRAIDLGLQEPGRDVPREERVLSHGLRGWSTNYAKEAGISTADLQLLRGDLSPGAIMRYDNYLARLPDLYRKYGPRLGL